MHKSYKEGNISGLIGQQLVGMDDENKIKRSIFFFASFAALGDGNWR